jgi:hypothetical protein
MAANGLGGLVLLPHKLECLAVDVALIKAASFRFTSMAILKARVFHQRAGGFPRRGSCFKILRSACFAPLERHLRAGALTPPDYRFFRVQSSTRSSACCKFSSELAMLKRR